MQHKRPFIVFFACVLLFALTGSAQEQAPPAQEPKPPLGLEAAGLEAAPQDDALLKDSGWNVHFQFTGILQGHLAFKAPYSGVNSLQKDYEQDYSVTTTLFLGRKLWKGAALYFNPEMAGGGGISGTRGIAGFPNGETFRIGDPQPTVYTGRIFLRQHISLDKDHYEDIDDDVNQIKERVSTSRINLTAGKFSLGDFFDNNNVSHDPRSDFMNWALMNNGAYDYAANTRGYTYGFEAELVKPSWTLRFATALEPAYSNGPDLDWHYTKTNSENLEFEKRYDFHGHKGAWRLLGFYNVNKAPNYDDAVAAKQNGTDTTLDAVYGKKYGSKKVGLGLNMEQEWSSRVNAFLRLGWNDGKNATWAFAEIDNELCAGIRISGQGWHRAADNIGIALLSNGLSAGHRNFLANGGYGFMIGDGKLPNYSRENIAELFYKTKLYEKLWGTLDYQFVDNPAYNRDRGPVSVFAVRVHVEL
jgi:high affinity Mn2+ porin